MYNKNQRIIKINSIQSKLNFYINGKLKDYKKNVMQEMFLEMI